MVLVLFLRGGRQSCMNQNPLREFFPLLFFLSEIFGTRTSFLQFLLWTCKKKSDTMNILDVMSRFSKASVKRQYHIKLHFWICFLRHEQNNIDIKELLFLIAFSCARFVNFIWKRNLFGLNGATVIFDYLLVCHIIFIWKNRKLWQYFCIVRLYHKQKEYQVNDHIEIWRISVFVHVLPLHTVVSRFVMWINNMSSESTLPFHVCIGKIWSFVWIGLGTWKKQVWRFLANIFKAIFICVIGRIPLVDSDWCRIIWGV